MDIRQIHEEAVACAKDFRKSEASLIDILQRVDEHQVFRKMNYPSLHVYAVEVLGLTDSEAYGFTRVARKSLEVPELKQAIVEGVLNVSKARRILTVIEPKTKHEWIEKAATLPQKQLEREVVKHNPKEAVRERLKPLSEDLSELRLSVPKELEAMLTRIKDLESQKTKRSASLIEALTAACQTYLKKHDPVKKAERNLGKAFRFASRRNLPAQVKHQVMHRDKGQCAFVDETGKRCKNRRWLEVHHVKPYAQGGGHEVGNLRLLCWHHHSFAHSHTVAEKVTGSNP